MHRADNSGRADFLLRDQQTPTEPQNGEDNSTRKALKTENADGRESYDRKSESQCDDARDDHIFAERQRSATRVLGAGCA